LAGEAACPSAPAGGAASDVLPRSTDPEEDEDEGELCAHAVVTKTSASTKALLMLRIYCLRHYRLPEGRAKSLKASELIWQTKPQHCPKNFSDPNEIQCRAVIAHALGQVEAMGCQPGAISASAPSQPGMPQD
jgi:hypothetical protein